MIWGSIFLLSWYLYGTTVNVQSGEVSWRFCRLYHVTLLTLFLACALSHMLFSISAHKKVHHEVPHDKPLHGLFNCF